ncbi:haloalkane dehalogenase [Chitinophaga sp. Mgbs1]|uniref:Haloalkane dehalogenase n=1 Tax=Chitinophaga solisilvae TaxID=1233460 RepID=A0A9Q5D7W2_9BACT|nr:haloalkane dehalogenase [Chitinophaga solisilvae]
MTVAAILSPVSAKKIDNIKKEATMEKKYMYVDGLKMAYLQDGKGDPIVFLHGNPASSYIWRNIIPHVKSLGNCIAPDLIGMGDSDKLPDSIPYTFATNQKYLDALFEGLDVKKNITFVVHDWGAALAFDWARRHPQAVKGIVYMEPVIAPRTWEGMPQPAKQLFQDLRSEKGEEMVLQQNLFIELILPKSILRQLSREEMDEYRKPYLKPGNSRQAMLSWVRQLPIDHEPIITEKIIVANGEYLSHATVPKLFIEADPGTMSPPELSFCRKLPNQTIVTVSGHHHLQEDSPEEIGEAIARWLEQI